MVDILRVPLIPLFLTGNSTPTIPHKYSQHKRSGFQVGSCDTAAADGLRGSNVYEVYPWLQCGSLDVASSALGGLSVEKTYDKNYFLVSAPCSGDATGTNCCPM